MIRKIVIGIAAAVVAAALAVLTVVLVRRTQAVLAQFKADMARKRARIDDTVTLAEDQIAQELGGMNSDITRIQRQLHIPDFPFPRRRRAG
jgi:hypothetical protein